MCNISVKYDWCMYWRHFKSFEQNSVDRPFSKNAGSDEFYCDIILELSNAISFSKAKYHERLAIKLSDPKTAPKTYWFKDSFNTTPSSK